MTKGEEDLLSDALDFAIRYAHKNQRLKIFMVVQDIICIAVLIGVLIWIGAF